ncbi:MAG: penicillin-binding protein 2 [Syntrophorhabdaceae bacterium]|nr:penicillin-binding protein 2 [Syntrophorhabdaceae bacterium]
MDFAYRRSFVHGSVEKVASGERLKQRIRKREQDPDIAYRISILLRFALCVLGLLFVRLYWLQIVDYDMYRELSENNRIRIRTIRAPRGPIFDRKGRPIAETQGSFDLVCSPIDVKDPEEVIRFLSGIVEFDADEDEIIHKIRDAMKTNPYTSITVARDLRFEQVSVIEFNREGLPGFSVSAEAKRSYPQGSTFAHVLGYVSEVSQEELKKSDDGRLGMGDFVGKYGLEKAMDDTLRGTNGGRRVEVDAAGRDQRLVEEVPSITGGSLYTTLDLDIQKAAREAMGNHAGSVIALCPKTGKVLAFYSAPAFDPNIFARGISKLNWQALNADLMKPMQNKGLQGTYAPGSTIKPFIALAALENRIIDKNARVNCTGALRLGNNNFRCWKGAGHGPVDMHQAIVQSCDVYFYTMGLRLGPHRIADMEKGVGLGTITGIDLPGERKGLIPDPEWKSTVSKERWMDYESLLLGVGQGPVHVTPLGMVVGYATLATGGKVMKPFVVTKAVNMDGKVKEWEPETLRKLSWDRKNTEFVHKSLASVVNDYGTGKAAKLPGITVGGKTGTAQVVQIKGKMIKSEDLPYEIRDHAWFAAFAPVEDPKIAVVAMVEHGGGGGAVAAPVVKMVLQEFFRTEAASEPSAASASPAASSPPVASASPAVTPPAATPAKPPEKLPAEGAN